MLVKWLGLPSDQRTREDVNTIKRLTSQGNLEDKIVSDGHGDLTFQLKLDTVVQHLKEDLSLSDLEVGLTGEEEQQGPRRSCQVKHNTKDQDFQYD